MAAEEQSRLEVTLSRAELNHLLRTQPLLDEMAPLYHVRDDAPPLLLITGDRELEMLGRYEENASILMLWTSSPSPQPAGISVQTCIAREPQAQ